MKACNLCGEVQQVKDYENIGRLAERIEIDTYPEYPSWWQKIRRILDQKYGKKYIHVTALYPII